MAPFCSPNKEPCGLSPFLVLSPYIHGQTPSSSSSLRGRRAEWVQTKSLQCCTSEGLAVVAVAAGAPVLTVLRSNIPAYLF